MKTPISVFPQVSSLAGLQRPGILDMARDGLRRLAAAWAAHRRRVRNTRALVALTDYELRDLGLSRVDAETIRVDFYRGDRA